MDYGHTLEFGSFLNPTSSAPQQAVEFARHAEDLGLDLVAFQDHPYLPGLLDAWTLMSYVAARTERVRIVPDVLNLPLRPPAVLARAAVSLDLLSNGRLEVALGAGYYWDAIEAMGGTRLSPGQSVAALDEAIHVLRETWDTDAPGGIQVDGSHYRLSGAKRGPHPAHPIPIHVGGMKPRMLELTGRAADGWLVSQPAMTPHALTAAGKLIDQAAVLAGRDPRAIRRMLNVDLTEGRTPEDLADELAALALDAGISVFFLVSDDPDVMRTFATRTAPAVRKLVSARRDSPADPTP
jgi:alkanesulfonate monooxygenase SsuD/methylene tetrahydromethanopterin reductase-like flavin-dependent oxidoreductase (luciferase family)